MERREGEKRERGGKEKELKGFDSSQQGSLALHFDILLPY
jgi:hypothetical protein